MAGQYYTLKACCDNRIKYVWFSVSLGYNVGDVFVDDNGVCWEVEVLGSEGCTNTLYTPTNLTYVGGTCSTCLAANPGASCPTLDITNQYNICVYWQNTGTNILFKVQSSGSPLNELYWIGAFGDGYTSTPCLTSSASGQWSGNILLNSGGGSFSQTQLASSTSGTWDLSIIRASLYNFQFSATTGLDNQVFSNISNGDQFVVCSQGLNGNELVNVYVAECLA